MTSVSAEKSSQFNIIELLFGLGVMLGGFAAMILTVIIGVKLLLPEYAYLGLSILAFAIVSRLLLIPFERKFYPRNNKRQ